MEEQIKKFIENNFEYKDEKFRVVGKRTTKPITDVAKDLRVHLFTDLDKVVSQEDCLLALEHYITKKNTPTIFIESGVDESIISQGNYVRLSLNGIKQSPNQLEIDLCSDFYYAEDVNGTVTIFLKNKNKYALVGDINNLKVGQAYSNIGKFADMHDKWETLLLNLGNRLKDAFNNKNSEEELTEIGKNEIPTCLLTQFESYIITIKQKLADEDVIVAKSIKWGKTNSNPTFIEYFESVIEKYHTLVIKKLSKFPAIYGNGVEEAINTFDTTPYITNQNITLNEAWEEMKSKYTENEWTVLTAWIWGVLDSRNKGRQALFIIDYQGFSGKSVLIDFLTTILSEKIVASLSLYSMKNSFGYSKVWDKRLVTIGDNKNNMIARTEWFHNILGGDYVDVEYKQRTSFTSKMAAKLLVCSNNSIEIDPNLLHERTRTIILKPKVNSALRDKMTAKDENGEVILDSMGNRKLLGDPNYLNNLLAGSLNFLSLCYRNYLILCPTNSEIILPNDVLETLYDIQPTSNQDIEYYINQFINVTDDFNDYILAKDCYEAFKQIQQLPKNNSIKNDNLIYNNIIEYLKKTKNLEFKQIRLNGTRQRVMKGVRLFSVESSDISFPIINIQKNQKHNNFTGVFE